MIISVPFYAQILPVRQNLKLTYDSISKQIDIRQDITIVNHNNASVDKIFFLNWLAAFKHKNTALAQRFMENYDLNFHFTRNKNRGNIILDSVISGKKLLNTSISIDDEIYQLQLPGILSPNDSIVVRFYYKIKLPLQKFTGFGIDKKGNMLLDNFYFQPVPFRHQVYRHKNIDDYPSTPSYFTVSFNNFPKKKIYSNLIGNDSLFLGKINHPVWVLTNKDYQIFRLDSLRVIIASGDKEIATESKKKLLNNIMRFVNLYLGEYPSDKILITEKDLKNFKVYGPDLIPAGFANPYSNELLWEMEMLHQITRKYMEMSLLDERKYPWIFYGIPAFLEYQYVENKYPELKLLGNLASYKLIKYYYASQVKMNEKYPWLYLYMARMNKDQKLSTTLDSLSNFNRNVAMPYKSALGLVMLQEQTGKNRFQKKLYEFYNRSLRNFVDADDFYQVFLNENHTAWFKTYINTRIKYDYKLTKLQYENDTLLMKIKKKQQANIPVTLFALVNNRIILRKNLPPLTGDTLLKIPLSEKPDYAGLNYFNNYPEIQFENNYKRLGKHLLNKPLQIRLYQDFDNPLKNQLFVNPFFEYNYYDGIILGTQIYNESFLHNYFTYSISPSYATKDKSLTGSFSMTGYRYFENYKPYGVRYGFNYRYYHYDHNLAYRRYNPYIAVKFRDRYLRKRKGADLVLQFMKIDKDPLQKVLESDKYSVFDVSYSGFDVNVIKDFFYKFDVQFADKFGKVSTMFRYRYLTNKNRQWDFRLYAGAFLYNHTKTGYFSFALDRPTDYLFQYHYYGRSENSGIFHQQFIWSEGGFKTFFPDQFADAYIISNNINIGIWKWFNLYGDWAWKKNRGERFKFYYDSGFRINLVQDYFEVFFPIYSKLGWETAKDDYFNRIRLVFTIDINGLFKMISRGWY
jgi:hypothetical protein